MSNSKPASVAIVILTFNRPEELLKTVSSLESEIIENYEIIVVDNASEIPAKEVLRDYSSIKVLTMDQNVGISARNEGIKASSGDVVVTLDDDVRGITLEELTYIRSCFSESSSLMALNFKVLEEETGKQINWCHHRKVEEWGETRFETYEISEGAVALRRQAVVKVGLYPDNYFISHEGPDLAIRLIDAGGDVYYDPNVKVIHARSLVARVSWRRYYYDTRNLIWFVYKYFGFLKASRKLIIGLGALFVYSLRDGFVRYWFLAVIDACRGIKQNRRQSISEYTWRRIKVMERFNPSFYYMLRKRLNSGSVEI